MPRHAMRSHARTPPLSAVPNLGPKSAAMLEAAGITSLEQLRTLGAVAAYARVKAAHARASLNLLWALEGAISGEPWQRVAREHRTSLLLALDDHLAREASRAPARGATLP